MQMDNQVPPKKVPTFCSLRYGLSFLLHFCNTIIMSQMICLNLTIVAMVNRTNPHGLPNTSTKELLDNIKNPVYDWSPEIQGLIFSSIFYGVLFTQVPVGYLSRIYSIKKMVGSALFLSSLLCLFIPLAAETGVTFVITCRVVQGAAQGTVSAAQHAIWIKWSPPLERGRLTSVSLSGAGGCALSLLWFVLFYDDPKDHPCINISEKEYITSSLLQQVSSSRQPLPIKAMLKSLPLWAISFGTFAFQWTNNIMILFMPVFLNSKLHVSIKQNGLLSAVPYLLAWMIGIIAGETADFLLSRNILSIVIIRKLFTTLGLLLPAFFHMCLCCLSSSVYGSIIFLVLANATGSFCLSGIIINALDIAPRYYGFLKGVTNLIGMLGALISSSLTGVILGQDPESSLFKTFYLIVAVNVISLIFCLVFIKAEIEDWAKEGQHTRL
nr:sodium-dependent phosphate transport protein 1-like isoform X2 [Manis javanica]